MNRRTKVIITAATLAGAIAAGAGVAIAAGGDNREGPISGPAYEKASAAALRHTGGGRVTDTETGDEESYYEVEVTRQDGSQVDVQLDRDFNVVGANEDDATDEAE